MSSNNIPKRSLSKLIQLSNLHGKLWLAMLYHCSNATTMWDVNWALAVAAKRVTIYCLIVPTLGCRWAIFPGTDKSYYYYYYFYFWSSLNESRLNKIKCELKRKLRSNCLLVHESYSLFLQPWVNKLNVYVQIFPVLSHFCPLREFFHLIPLFRLVFTL